MINLKKKEYFTNISLAYFNKALKKGLNESEVFVSLGNAHFMLAKLDESIENYRIAEKMTGFNPIINYNIALLLYNKKEWKKSAEVCIKAAAKQIEIYSEKSNKIKLKDKEIVENLIPIVSPQMIGKYNLLTGMNYEELKEPDKAAEYYEIALKYLAMDDQLNQRLGCIYYAKKNFDNARKFLERAVELNPNNAKSRELLKLIK